MLELTAPIFLQFIPSVDFSKEPRRRLVMKNYDVFMLPGDNLNDFAQVFEDRLISDRLNEADKFWQDWGTSLSYCQMLLMETRKMRCTTIMIHCPQDKK
jgi:predicted secreted acid phosphatase